MLPHSSNFCGGNFQDWLEVNLLKECNGKCSWCIERNGYHPAEHTIWQTIVEQALKSGKTNIILLGGEPTLYKDIALVIRALSANSRKVWVTTNGGLLSSDYVIKHLSGITGINISIHDDDLTINRSITGVTIRDLSQTITALHSIGASVRLNCNCIKGHIDSAEAIDRYIAFAKSIGADKIRFAELKQDDNSFVDLAEVLGHRFGLNDDPFAFGCNSDAVIDGMPVNFRQMCGLQTSKRPRPDNPEQFAKEVLYYDGKFYDGWQTNSSKKEVKNMTDRELERILENVANGQITPAEAAKEIKENQDSDNDEPNSRNEGSTAGCQY